MKEKLFIIIFLFFFMLGCSVNEEGQSNINHYEWELSTFSESGIDSLKIQEALNRGSELNYLYSILVIRHGKIVAEKYYNGFSKNSDCSIRSVSKSFLSAAYGLAIQKNILALDNKLTNILNNYDHAITDSRIADITIKHLITMKSGFAGDTDIYSSVVNSPNWLEKIFSMSLINNPGKQFKYTTPGTHLLSAALTRSSEMSSLEFVKENLLDKMQISIANWEQDPQGVYFGGNNMYFTTRDMAVLGLLYLNEGVINNQQILSSSWIEESLEYHTSGTNSWGPMKNIGYGYLWWLGEIQDYKIFTAIGHGGQFVLCMPEVDLIVATNASSNIWWEEANIQELEILNIIGDYIIPAINTP